MAGMSTHTQAYTFEVTQPALASVATGDTTRFEAVTFAHSVADALTLVSRRYPEATLLTLALVQPHDGGCASSRCLVCYPGAATGAGL